ncbi:beta-propeller fold lactonase family protein [uncultured Brachybacterium sp.]|uniref:beta-propeller fold lactonase family protein n=1 Tax=uncultured Brachybacterium sp. TaxID=189680 RepID=UPI00260C0A80|nr:beta-propeller fold lactonase family protein [uncultured Brachybacterium sp.]
MSVQAKHHRKVRRERPHDQFTVAIAILSLVMAGGMVGGLVTSVVTPEGGSWAAGAVPELPPGDPSNTTRLTHLERITGDITPKSVVASPAGTVIANNMMYSHSSTLYDAETLELTHTVADTIDLAEFGYPDRAGTTEGAPVEAVFSPDGKYAYVSQYRLRGPGEGAAASDDCANGEAIGRSAVFRLDLASGQWDQVIEVGRVPKFISLSADGSTALVSNWCDETVSVLDLEAGEEIREIPVDAAPRGSVILPDNRTAYVTAMYADEMYKLDLETGQSELVLETGRKPRHLVLSPDATRMYLTVSGSDELLELDAATGEVLRTAPTGREPRTMAISPDGLALYVVNYYANTVSKFDTETLEEIQSVEVGKNPIGITYEPTQRRVWVANYAGSIDVFDDTAPGGTVEP